MMQLQVNVRKNSSFDTKAINSLTTKHMLFVYSVRINCLSEDRSCQTLTQFDATARMAPSIPSHSVNGLCFSSRRLMTCKYVFCILYTHSFSVACQTQSNRLCSCFLASWLAIIGYLPTWWHEARSFTARHLSGLSAMHQHFVLIKRHHLPKVQLIWQSCMRCVHGNFKVEQESCAIAKMTARCALYK